VLALLVPRAGPDSDEATGWTLLLGSRQNLLIFNAFNPVVGPTEPPFVDTDGSLLRYKAADA
jgi:hypothetical protein